MQLTVFACFRDILKQQERTGKQNVSYKERACEPDCPLCASCCRSSSSCFAAACARAAAMSPSWLAASARSKRSIATFERLSRKPSGRIRVTSACLLPRLPAVDVRVPQRMDKKCYSCNWTHTSIATAIGIDRSKHIEVHRLARTEAIDRSQRNRLYCNSNAQRR